MSPLHMQRCLLYQFTFHRSRTHTDQSLFLLLVPSTRGGTSSSGSLSEPITSPGGLLEDETSGELTVEISRIITHTSVGNLNIKMTHCIQLQPGLWNGWHDDLQVLRTRG